MLQVDLLHHSILGRRARVQSDDHHVQANLPAAKTTIHTMRNRNIETAKLACFLNSRRPSLLRVVRRKKIERTKRKIGIAAARKAMILKIIVLHSQRDTETIKYTDCDGGRGGYLKKSLDRNTTGPLASTGPSKNLRDARSSIASRSRTN